MQLRSIFYFLVAGLCEIGGGYLIWLWLRGGKSLPHAIVGAAVLILYGIVAAQQPANFGRVYAAYGGFFIALSILWGWQVDGVAPDRWDWIGGAVAILGAWLIFYAPRG